MAARVGFDLGAVHRDGAQLEQPHLARQSNDLHEQIAELLEVKRPKVAQRAVRREVACPEQAKRHVFVQLAGKLT